MKTFEWLTERLRILPTNENDFNYLVPMLLDYDVSKYIEKQPIQFHSYDVAQSYLMSMIRFTNAFTIKIKDTNDTIGLIGYSIQDSTMSIFFMIGTEYQCKGYATEASLEFYNHIFEESFCKSLLVEFNIENIGSLKVSYKIKDFILKRHPDWFVSNEEDKCIVYEVEQIDENTVFLSTKLKLNENEEDTKHIQSPKIVFPDEY